MRRKFGSSFGELTQKLNPYSTHSNLERSKSALDSHGDLNLTLKKSREIQGIKTDSGLSVIILTLNRPEYICPLILQLLDEKTEFEKNGFKFEIIVGDTGSTDPQVKSFYQQYQKEIRLFENIKYHFSKNNNQLFQESKMNSVLFLNNDIILPNRKGSLFKLFKTLSEKPDYGILGTFLFFENRTVQHAGIEFLDKPEFRGLPYHPFSRELLAPTTFESFVEVPAVTGAFLLIRSELFWSLDGMDSIYTKECQDVALCLAARRMGKKVGLVNLGEVIHIENGTRPKMDESWGDRQIFLRRWSSFIAKYLENRSL